MTDRLPPHLRRTETLSVKVSPFMVSVLQEMVQSSGGYISTIIYRALGQYVAQYLQAETNRERRVQAEDFNEPENGRMVEYEQ